MKKLKKSLLLSLTLLLLICVASLSASAATNIQYQIKSFYVTDWASLKSALETTTTEASPKDVYVQLNNDITETMDGYTDIAITYPGNITLDLNGHNISVSSVNGDSLFFIKGTNATVFSIINTQQNSNNAIIFNSSVSGSSLLYSNNPNASINVLGAFRACDDNKYFAPSYNIRLETNSMPDNPDEKLHITLNLQRSKDVYISGARLHNKSMDPVNIYMQFKPNSLRLAGKTALNINTEDNLSDRITYANIYLHDTLSSYTDFKIFENCFVYGNAKIKSYSIRESYAAAETGPVERECLGFLLYGVDYGDSSINSYYLFLNENRVTNPNGQTKIKQNAVFCIKSNCCESNVETKTEFTNYGHITKCSNCNSVISVKLHSLKSNRDAVLPTCKKEGKSDSFRCTVGSDCPYVIKSVVLPKTHTRIIKDPGVKATCLKEGRTASEFCADCNTIIVAPRTIAKKDHNIVTVPGKAATCSATGLTEGKKCSVCGTVTVAQKSIPATAHKEVTVPGKAATCTSTGLTEGKKCSVCGTVTVAQKSIPATGHKEVTVPGKAATCTSTGLTDGKKCSVCGTITLAQRVIAKKAHTYKTTTTKATLKANGSVTTKCAVCGSVKSSKTINQIKSVKLAKTSYTYNKKSKTPSVTVKDTKGNKLQKGKDYTVKYSKGRKNVGTYKVTVTFIGNYSGTKTLTFKIVPKSTEITSLTGGKKQLTVKWDKQTAQTSGYEIAYSTSSKMKKAKKVTVKKNKTTSTKIKKLKSNKKYYVRIRTYKTVDGKKIYSSWSPVVSVKTK